MPGARQSELRPYRLNRFHRLPDNLKGIVFLMLASIVFALMALLIKLLGQRLHITQILLVRQLGMVILVAIGAYSFNSLTSDGGSLWSFFVWGLLLLVVLGGLWFAFVGLREEANGRSAAAGGDYDRAAVLLRKAIKTTTLALIVPAVGLVLAIVVATPERADTEKANESASAQSQPVEAPAAATPPLAGGGN